MKTFATDTTNGSSVKAFAEGWPETVGSWLSRH
jgi:hypothetical protein